MDDVVERLSRLAPGHPVRFHAGVRPAPALLDAVRLEQIMGNLISNAAKYGEPTDEILIDLSRYGFAYKVAVVNHGHGIDPVDMPKLFQRFYRSEMTRSSSIPGLGVGLYICKGLVEAHGGRIWVENTSGETTTFHFTIPMLHGSSTRAAA
jgi:signal transduction histidine kinase